MMEAATVSQMFDFHTAEKRKIRGSVFENHRWSDGCFKLSGIQHLYDMSIDARNILKRLHPLISLNTTYYLYL
jgi:hypothetical protein